MRFAAAIQWYAQGRISLFKSGQAALLPAVYQQIYVPDAVWREISGSGHDDAASRELASAPWAIRLPPQTLDPAVIAWDAGSGETEVLAYAHANRDVRAVVYDDYARRCAQSLGIRTLGTCAVVVLAKRRGVIAEVKPCLEALRAAGLWLSEGLLRTVLSEAGE